jgi:phosphoserine phosphatase
VAVDALSSRRFDLVAFDMDGVLVDYRSCWTWVHDHFGVSNEASYLDFIEGRIDDMEFMRRDIALWREKRPELEEEDLRCILDPMPITDGIGETVSALRRAGIRTAIVSGGLDIVAQRIAQRYGFDEYWANGVETDENGRLTGEGVLRVELRNKGTALQAIMRRCQIQKERTACVGDSFIDIPMFEACGMSIAYNPTDEKVGDRATHVVVSRDLQAILSYIL